MLEPGQKLSHYRLIEEIGTGGMGVVWSAEDTVLGRTVALKFLPTEFSRDPERLAPLQREARFLASLSHPNIAAIHGLEQAECERFLVLEYVPGDSLAQRLQKGALPVEHALKVGCEIARALEAAHDRGVIHRDLKPGNVQLMPDGHVKVLDFGLAKAIDPPTEATERSQRTTVTLATNERTVVGTTPYMSPEQASAKPVDKRADIWSFGCLLYELLTGRRAFPGDTAASTFAAIHGREPDWQLLPTDTPVKVRDLLCHCLQKDPDRRLHDIADGRIEIVEALEQPTDAASAPRAALIAQGPVRRAGALLLLFTTLVLVAIGTVMVTRNRPPATRVAAPRVARFSIPLDADHSLRALTVSRDGRTIAYSTEHGKRVRLYVRATDQLEAAPLPGTEGLANQAGGLGGVNLHHLFFSPDGQWIGFVADGKLKRVSSAGGTPVVLREVATHVANFTASWGPERNIVFSDPMDDPGLQMISDSGGAAEVVATPDIGQGETLYFGPEFLPGGNAVLFTIETRELVSSDEASIAVLALESGRKRILVKGGYNPRYAPSGHVVFARAGKLLAVPFDPVDLQVTGPPVAILGGVRMNQGNGWAHFAFAHDGTLVFGPGGVLRDRVLVWVDRQGSVQPLPVEAAGFRDLRLSPDGDRLAVTIGANHHDIWIYDLVRGSATRLTFEGDNHFPVWSPDGRWIAFRSRLGTLDLYRVPTDGSGPAELLLSGEGHLAPTSWSPDGKFLAFENGPDVELLDIRHDRDRRVFLESRFSEAHARFSPDGRWIAYTSDESGSNEVYVRRFPGPSGKWHVSTNGGEHPTWSPSGRELFYRNRDRVMSVAIDTAPSFVAGPPRLLFRHRFPHAGPGFFDVGPDGRRFVMIRREEEPEPDQIIVVQNWFDELTRKMGESI